MFALLIWVVLLLQASHAQTHSPTLSDDTITEKEKLELRAFTQEFLDKLKKTRDVRPLLTRYFANDFATFSYLYLSDDETKSKAPVLSRSERKRFVLAFLNFLYITAPYMLLGPVNDFDKRLPPQLRLRYLMTEKSMDNEDLLKTRRSVFKYIRQMENFTDDLRRYSTRKKIESSEAYQDGVRKRQNIDAYNFSITEDSPETDSEHAAARWLRQQGYDVRTFTVGTPYGMAIVIIRVKGEYKTLFLWPWPISYDSRLN